jgi:N-methylhydantoinase B
VVTVIKIGGENTKLVTFGEGDVEAPLGAHEGKPGTLNRIELRYPDGRTYGCTTKDLVDAVPEGTIYYQEAGGGGGYGDPFKRPIAKVQEEVRNGILSVDKAKEDYGVVIDPVSLEVDRHATRAIRR